MINKVTITGADDSIDPTELVQLQNEFPFVEWGILVSRKNFGTPRFPSHDWIERLKNLQLDHAELSLSCHLCGSVVREFLRGEYDFIINGVVSFWPIFSRVQINTHGQVHEYHLSKISEFIRNSTKEFIIQYDNVNTNVFEDLMSKGLTNVSALFDLSHGAGILPGEWPKPLPNAKCGYAGGLGPDNLESQILLIENLVQSTNIWIDMETRVRSNSDTLFDLEKVRKCLEVSAKFIHKIS